MDNAQGFDGQDNYDGGGGGFDGPDPEIEQAVQQAVDARMAPIEQSQLDAQRYAEAEDLVADYPHLQQQEHAVALVAAAREEAAALGAPELADSPAFWRLVHERSAGAPDHSAQPADDPRVEQIMSGGHPGLGSRVLDFQRGPGADDPMVRLGRGLPF